ncbi:MAG TPA: cbb3-type cytochrome c oxidase subunit I [Anaerolineales bacterium]|nr:cbb3-type cytochrome c oxidase subunit I [Anaerolineales bacterium]
MSRGMRSYLRPTTDPAVLAVQFLVTSFAFFLLGGALALGMAAEASVPGVELMGAEAYSRAFTNHGSIMIFLWLMPAVAGLTHALLLRVLGATRSALPRLSGLGFWLLLPGGLLMLSSFFMGGDSPGWTAYLPLSAQTTGVGQTLWVASLIVLLLSLGCNATGFLATILAARSEKSRSRSPFVVASLISSTLALISAPVLLAALTALLVDRLSAGPSFLAGSLGVTLWQNAFWFFGHPATTMLLLPAIGAVSEVIQANTGNPLVAKRSVNLAMVAVGGLGLVSWGQHMFASGLIPAVRVPFMLTSMAVAIPLAFIVFAWLTTLWVSKVRFSTPMLFSLGFISMFGLAGLSGLVLASIPANLQLHGSTFVSGHSHLALFGGVMSGLFAGIYYVFPTLTGKNYDENLGKLHFLAHAGGVHLAFLPMLLIGLQGVPRRVFEIRPGLELFELASSGGALILAGASLLFLYNIFFAWRAGRPAAQEVLPGSTL